ncbi:MAG: pyruvate dehydrogenase [Sulfobacillus benefaciens]|uniref:Pyruvate dehydrogenase n=1 Tax=Sulfobacillus benefaciens TaxID=453960 RepID=A0A2T2XDM9_9FIRM|nr:MAG: pyruvate dehydrogenase [Sulfobacillus benefaciens]
MQQIENTTTPITTATALDWYRTMHRIRRFDETIDELFAQGKVHGTTHLYIGEEAVATGVIATLEPGDVITSTHRGHGHNIALGGDIQAMMAELLGRATGYCHGVGGSMHIADQSRGNLGANGIVGAGLPIAVGAALGFAMRHESHLVVAFTGDGALNEGAFHEAANLAAIWRLPVVFVVENNQYGMSGSVKEMFAIGHLADRAAGYGIPATMVDGMDIFSVWETASRAVEAVRKGQGPHLIEAVTYRYKGHSKSDANRYRSRDEIQQWRQRDPIDHLRRYLADQGIDPTELDRIRQEEVQAVAQALQYAEDSPWPEVRMLDDAVYALEEGDHA